MAIIYSGVVTVESEVDWGQTAGIGTLVNTIMMSFCRFGPNSVMPSPYSVTGLPGIVNVISSISMTSPVLWYITSAWVVYIDFLSPLHPDLYPPYLYP